MNQPLPSDPSQNQFQTPQQPQTTSQAQPQAQPQVPPQAQMPPASSPFEQPVQVNQIPASQPLATPPVGTQQSGFQPNEMQPASTGLKSSKWLIIGLVIILFIGVLVFASWQGWINLGSVSNLWKKSEPAVVVPVVVEDKTNANDKLRKADLVNLKAALKNYYQANQAYPIATTTQKTSDATNPLAILVPSYIAVLPLDPLSPTYYYGYKSDGLTFELTCVLEDATDTSGTLIGANNIYKITDISVETPATSNAQNTTVVGTSPDATTSGSTVNDTDTSSGSATGSSSASSSATSGQ